MKENHAIDCGPASVTAFGVRPEHFTGLADLDPIRRAEVASIRAYVESKAGHLRGRVLDYGAGKPGTCREPQPYRHHVQGEYVPYDIGDPEPEGPFDAILCTQVLHMVGPVSALRKFNTWLKPRGFIVMTYPTNWDVVEAGDLFRYTPHGMTRMLTDTGFEIRNDVLRAQVTIGGFRFPLGYGVVACKA